MLLKLNVVRFTQQYEVNLTSNETLDTNTCMIKTSTTNCHSSIDVWTPGIYIISIQKLLNSDNCPACLAIHDKVTC